jgi:sec-independent protein translocase protein TatA
VGSIGIPELILIFVVALLLFGPKKLPDIGRTIGKAMGEFRRASNDLKHSLEEEVAADELRRVRQEVREASDVARAALTEQIYSPEPYAPEPAPPEEAPAEPSPAAGSDDKPVEPH